MAGTFKSDTKLKGGLSRARFTSGIVRTLLAAALIQGGGAPAVAAPPISLAPAIGLSDQVPDFDHAAKSRIIRLSNGTLVVAYLDTVEDEPTRYVYDLQADVERPARDIFVRACDSATTDCTDPLDWTTSVNISNTATLSSIDTDWTGDTDGSGERTPYHGDSGKSNIFGSGDYVVVTWVDKYCPAADSGQMTPQRTITYLERNDREVPFSCLYVAHASGDGIAVGNWIVNRLTDGSRDANQDVNRGMQNGGWAIIWQEDPRGLQPGEAEGPGDGASGARVSFGTDVWYTYSPTGQFGSWQPPSRLTDNQTGFGITRGLEELNPIKDANGDPIDLTPEAEEIENGETGASRPNLVLVSNTAIVAYEETKGGEDHQIGAGPGDEAAGKYVRYQHFPFQDPPTNDADKAGCIVSSPEENARRARLVAQGQAGSSGLRWIIFWRQGIGGQGATADIVLRSGKTDFEHANLIPEVDPGCETSDFNAAGSLENDPPLNMSSNTPDATQDNLFDTTSANRVENARAHRVLLRGDDFYLGYTYTKYDFLAQLSQPLANYDFWLRRCDAMAGVCMPPQNLSGIRRLNVDAKEPRLVGTPGNGPDCPTDPEQCQDTSTFFAAWGTERTDRTTGETVDVDIFITYTNDKGENFARARRIAQDLTVPTVLNSQAESQLRSTPDGSRVFSVWNEKDPLGAVNTRFTVGTTR
jgi:hypothetical protein